MKLKPVQLLGGTLRSNSQMDEYRASKSGFQ